MDLDDGDEDAISVETTGHNEKVGHHNVAAAGVNASGRNYRTGTPSSFVSSGGNGPYAIHEQHPAFRSRSTLPDGRVSPIQPDSRASSRTQGGNGAAMPPAANGRGQQGWNRGVGF